MINQIVYQLINKIISNVNYAKPWINLELCISDLDVLKDI